MCMSLCVWCSCTFSTVTWQVCAYMYMCVGLCVHYLFACGQCVFYFKIANYSSHLFVHGSIRVWLWFIGSLYNYHKIVITVLYIGLHKTHLASRPSWVQLWMKQDQNQWPIKLASTKERKEKSCMVWFAYISGTVSLQISAMGKHCSWWSQMQRSLQHCFIVLWWYLSQQVQCRNQSHEDNSKWRWGWWWRWHGSSQNSHQGAGGKERVGWQCVCVSLCVNHYTLLCVCLTVC